MILLVNGTKDFEKEMNTRYDSHHSYTKQKMQLLKNISKTVCFGKTRSIRIGFKTIN